ncbi:recombinase family protein [Rhodococcus erythropolis]|nr:recombinase family protein [Rhodococcus erythropolis]MDV6278138.1 recombinase family protein [Rhodococcus erythropolis]
MRDPIRRQFIGDQHSRPTALMLQDLPKEALFGLGSQIYDWANPFGKLFLQTLAMVAEFEANLNHLRTREGMAKARAKG